MMRLELETPVFFLDNGKVNHEMIGKVLFIPANFFHAEGEKPGLLGYTAEAIKFIEKTDRKGLKVGSGLESPLPFAFISHFPLLSLNPQLHRDHLAFAVTLHPQLNPRRRR